jgi:hypothetical protein
MRNEYSIDQEVELEVNGNLYTVHVKGTKVRNDFDDYDLEIERVYIYDFLGDDVIDGHEDYDDIMEEVSNLEFFPEYDEDYYDDYESVS